MTDHEHSYDDRSYEDAMKFAEMEDDAYRADFPSRDPNDLKGEWLIVEDAKNRLVGPFFQDHSALLSMIDTLVKQGYPRKAIAIDKGTRAKWKLEGVKDVEIDE